MNLIKDLVDKLKKDKTHSQEYKEFLIPLLANFERLAQIEDSCKDVTDFMTKFFLENNFELNVVTYLFSLHLKINRIPIIIPLDNHPAKVTTSFFNDAIIDKDAKKH